jgi:hypothetical protein
MMALSSTLASCQTVSALGAGGMGELQRAWDIRLNCEFAINSDDPRR